MLRNRYYRIYVIVSMVVRFFLQVWWFNRRHRTGSRSEIQEKWERLVEGQAREYKRTALKLGGLLIKMGQFLSTRADVMPRAFTNELTDLTDRVPSVPWEESRKILEEELNHSAGTLFDGLSTGPVASASIGEVYQAYLKSGQKVAIKIQRPGIDKIIDADFAATRVVIQLARRYTRWGKMTDLHALYGELERTVSKELDFRKEYAHAKRFMEMYARDPTIEIPRYYEEFMTRRTLVMDWIEGEKVTDHQFLEAHRIDKRYVVSRISRMFLEQVLKEGFFHADLHPGNIFIKPNGTIVLLDFGMVGEIKREARKYIQDLVQSVVLKDYDGVVEALDRLHFLTPNADREQMKIALQFGLEMYFRRDYSMLDDDMLEKMLTQLQDFVREQPIQLPAEYAFLGRAFSTIAGVVTTILPDVDFLEVGKPIVNEWLNVQGTTAENRKTISDTLKNVATGIGRELIVLPRQVNRWIDADADFKYYQRKQEETRAWLIYYKERQRTAGFFAALSWGSAVALWITHFPVLAYVSVGVLLMSAQRLFHYHKTAANMLKEHSRL
jgi:predicted unusual protein kinase regulating ubiquinone biosynthesis (AarF/ABC1/UbiB family)